MKSAVSLSEIFPFDTSHLGIFAGTYLAAHFTRARLNPELAWADVFGLAALAGIGFTVSLLIGELTFPGAATGEHVKAAVLVGCLISAARAALLLRRRNAVYRHLSEEENRTGTRTATASPTSTSAPPETGRTGSG